MITREQCIKYLKSNTLDANDIISNWDEIPILIVNKEGKGFVSPDRDKWLFIEKGEEKKVSNYTELECHVGADVNDSTKDRIGFIFGIDSTGLMTGNIEDYIVIRQKGKK